MENLALYSADHLASEYKLASSGIEFKHADYVDNVFSELSSQYLESGKPLQVDFRKLVYWEKYSESYTHYIHKYPAKLLKHIPIFFLRSGVLLENDKSTVLDPFAGTGTVMLEAMLSGHNAIGSDSNPVARLISEVKTHIYKIGPLDNHLDEVLRRARRYKNGEKRNVVNVDHWFPKKTQEDLGRLVRSIEKIQNQKIRNFFKVTLSSTLLKCSFADPRVSVPVKLNADKYSDEKIKSRILSNIEEIRQKDVFSIFNNEALENIKRVSKLSKAGLEARAKIIGDDARCLGTFSGKGERVRASSVDLIITSPPYAGAQKYIRSTSLNLGWLNYCDEYSLRDYERKTIGREHYSTSEYRELCKINIPEIDEMLEKIWMKNRLRAHINGNYLFEMEKAIGEMYRVLKKGSYCVLVIGNNEVCGEQFNTQEYIAKIAARVGFSLELKLVDRITSRGLMTKRNKTASVINSEWILVFRKWR